MKKIKAKPQLMSKKTKRTRKSTTTSTCRRYAADLPRLRPSPFSLLFVSLQLYAFLNSIQMSTSNSKHTWLCKVSLFFSASAWIVTLVSNIFECIPWLLTHLLYLTGFRVVQHFRCQLKSCFPHSTSSFSFSLVRFCLSVLDTNLTLLISVHTMPVVSILSTASYCLTR